MQKLVLDSVRWARGERKDVDGPLQNLLLGKDGCMCCLGFYLAACGVASDMLFAEGSPEDVCFQLAEDLQPEDAQGVEPVPRFLAQYDANDATWTDTTLTDDMVGINDDPNIETDEERVLQLNARLSASRIQLEVVLVETPEECEAAGGLPANFGKSAA